MAAEEQVISTPEEVAPPADEIPVESVASPVGSTDDGGATSSVEPTPEGSVEAPTEVVQATEEAPIEGEVKETAPSEWPNADEFSWDDWDGTHESVPELVQPWAQKFTDYHTQRFQAQQKDLDETRKIYEALLTGEQDPRVEELTTEKDSWKGKYETLNETHTAHVAATEELLREEADAWARWFYGQHEELFQDAKVYDHFNALQDEGWIAEDAVVLAQMPENVVEVARRAKADKVPIEYALKLAYAELAATEPPAPPEPRPGAQLTSGADTSPRTNDSVRSSVRDVRGLTDKRMVAAERAWNKAAK